MSRSMPRVLQAVLASFAFLAACGPAAPPRVAPGGLAPDDAAPTTRASGSTAATAAAPQVTHVRYASQFNSSDVPLYLGLERGYLQQEGIDLELARFGNSSEIIPSLATGQVDAASVGSNPATWNSIARGIPLKIMLDKGSFRPGWGDQALAIRKAVNDARSVQSLRDVRGLTLAATPPGKATASGCVLAAGLQRVGMTLDDVNVHPCVGKYHSDLRWRR